MPRLNTGRSVQAEVNLARRIAHERAKRQQSYEGLAEAMTKAGCAIAGSSIYKIEKGNPPRRVAVDELVTLAEVWDLPIGDLLMPMDLIEQRRAHQLIEALRKAERSLGSLGTEFFEVCVELLALIRDQRELYEYVMNHFKADPSGGGHEDRWEPAESGEVVTFEEVVRLRGLKAMDDFRGALLKAAGLWAAGRDNELTDEQQEGLESELTELKREFEESEVS